MPSIHRFLPSGGESLNIMYDLYMCHPLGVYGFGLKEDMNYVHGGLKQDREKGGTTLLRIPKSTLSLGAFFNIIKIKVNISKGKSFPLLITFTIS